MRGMAEAVAERGYAATRVGDVTGRAGVSRRTFYEHFSGKDECFLTAYDEMAAHLALKIRDAYAVPGPWAARLNAGIGAFLAGLAAEPAFARMCLVEVLAAGPAAMERRRRAIDDFAALLATSHREAGAPPPPFMAYEILVGGIYEALYARLQTGHASELPLLLSDLAECVLLPLVGRNAS